MKLRPDSLWARLNPEQRDVLFDLLGRKGYEDGQALCAKWKITTSSAGLSRCYSAHAFEWKLNRARAAAAATEDLGNFDAETSRLVAQKTFEELSKASPNPAFIAMTRAYELEKRKVELAERSAITRASIEKEKLKIAVRKLRLLEKREVKARDTLSNSALTPEQQKARLKEIFGL